MAYKELLKDTCNIQLVINPFCGSSTLHIQEILSLYSNNQFAFISDFFNIILNDEPNNQISRIFFILSELKFSLNDPEFSKILLNEFSNHISKDTEKYYKKVIQSY